MSRTMFRTHDATQAAAPHDRSDVIGRLGAHMTRLMTDEEGMSTAEYAIGTIAAAAFGAVLYTVVSGDSIPDALGDIIEQALNPSV